MQKRQLKKESKEKEKSVSHPTPKIYAMRCLMIVYYPILNPVLLKSMTLSWISIESCNIATISRICYSIVYQHRSDIAVRTKRLVLGLLFSIIMSLSSAIFASNLQKTYTMNDDVFVKANRLAMESGFLGPSPVSPSTGMEIKNALERLDYNSLSKNQQEDYDAIIKELDSSELVYWKRGIFEIDPVVQLAFDAYAFSDITGTYKDEFFLPYRDMNPLILGELHMFFSDAIYFDFQYIFKDSPTGFSLNEKGDLTTGDLFYNFTNMSMLITPSLAGEWKFGSFMSARNVYSMLVYQPFKLGLSIGNEYINFQIGRNRQEFGNGIIGNMLVGDNFSYQDMMRFSVFSDIFSYYLSFTHFDNVSPGRHTSFSFNGPHQTRLIHRFDFNILNKVRFVFNMGGLFTTDSPFDWRMFTPMMVVHNWCNNKPSTTIKPGDEGNNIISFELEIAMAKGWFLSGQFVLDQLHVLGEEGDDVPNAFGLMLNVKNTERINEKGYLDSWIEFVYTNPYLYLNYKENEDGSRNYYYDFILGYGYGKSSEVNYTGHGYGPDSIGIAIGTKFSSRDDKWTVGGSVLYKVHGENGMERSYWPKQQSTNRVEDGKSYNYITPTGTPEH